MGRVTKDDDEDEGEEEKKREGNERGDDEGGGCDGGGGGNAAGAELRSSHNWIPTSLHLLHLPWKLSKAARYFKYSVKSFRSYIRQDSNGAMAGRSLAR